MIAGLLRTLLGVVCGYALFAVAAVAIFAISGRDPHEAADPTFMAASIGGGALPRRPPGIWEP